jgi:hypothetical protein
MTRWQSIKEIFTTPETLQKYALSNISGPTKETTERHNFSLEPS